jgi:tRNA-splicing ligase RtcB (3'-phosphate/5'-hydroxy nucleic acid ligase)
MIANATPEVVSPRAFERGRDQLGTLGSGNHFIEVQVVDKVFDSEAAQAFGLHEGQITLMIHTGSRGYGYQICDDFLVELDAAVKKYGFKLPDRQLAAAPIKSPEGQRYIGAMAAAANYAFANRQILMHLARDVFKDQFGKLGNLNLIYDVAHNIAKFEKYVIDGKMVDVLVHRKGATRALPKGHELVPARYRHIGQPVLIPGDMGTHSYILVGDEKTLTETFGSTCHGAGRLMSREAAIRNSKDRNIKQELNDKGIEVKWVGRDTLREEMSDAYKNVNDVVDVVDGARLSRKVARMRPLGVVKG